MIDTEKGRKTTVPVKTIPQIVDWLLKNCSMDELEFMTSIASNKRNFGLLNSILKRLTDFNIYEVFYERFSDPNELLMFRASKRGEVAGLKAFEMACQAAKSMVEKNKGRR